MSFRIAVLSDVHGNSIALEAVRKAVHKEKPDAVMVAGDLVMNCHDPAGAVDILREMESHGAFVVQGNTDIAVAARDVADWTHDQLDDERLSWLRRLPAERRLRIGDDLVLLTHASPGSQTQGF